MCQKKNHSQIAGSVECGRDVPMSTIALLPVMMIIFVEEKLKLL